MPSTYRVEISTPDHAVLMWYVNPDTTVPWETESHTYAVSVARDVAFRLNRAGAVGLKTTVVEFVTRNRFTVSMPEPTTSHTGGPDDFDLPRSSMPDDLPR